MREGDEALDSRPASGELEFRLPVVRGDPPQEVGPCPFRVDAADVVFFPLRPSVRPFVMPEIEVPATVEIPDASAAPDLISYL
jgi:hypothetical protein